MKKLIPLLILAFFSLRLYASVGPHVHQLEHDSFTFLRSALIVGSLVFVSQWVVKYFKKDRNK